MLLGSTWPIFILIECAFAIFVKLQVTVGSCGWFMVPCCKCTYDEDKNRSWCKYLPFACGIVFISRYFSRLRRFIRYSIMDNPNCPNQLPPISPNFAVALAGDTLYVLALRFLVFTCHSKHNETYLLPNLIAVSRLETLRQGHARFPSWSYNPSWIISWLRVQILQPGPFEISWPIHTMQEILCVCAWNWQPGHTFCTCGIW